MHADVLLVLITILVALIFDFVNGFHDSANSIATVVSTRVLSPRWAVVWAAAFNFLAAFFLGTAVALVVGAADFFIARADRRIRRRGDGKSRSAVRYQHDASGHYSSRMDQNARFHRCRTANGAGSGIYLHVVGVLDLPALGAAVC